MGFKYPKLKNGTLLDPSMAYNNQNNHKQINKELVKFVVPKTLKTDLQDLANERNISVSSLLRLITSDYVKRNKST
jgi:hypothetical protein